MTLDPDVEALLKAAMAEQRLTFDLGFRPDIPYDKALQLASAVEDQELARKLALGK